MKYFRLAAALALTAVFASVAVLPAFAQDGDQGKVVFGGSYTVASGETLLGDLVAFGGRTRIEEGGLVKGDVLIMGGSLDIEGAVSGDVVVFGGFVDIAATAQIDGDLVRIGGSLDVEPGAAVGGEVREDGGFDLPGLWSREFAPPFLAPSSAPPPDLQSSPGAWLIAAFLTVARAVAMVAALGALALVVSLVSPRGVERIGRAGAGAPFLALSAGALTWLVGLALMAMAAITICLLPVALLLLLTLLAVAVLSWIVAGWWVGRRLLALLNVARPTTVLEATIGTVLVAGVYALLGILPCVGFIFAALVLCFGAGAIALTRFGTRAFPPSLAVAPVAPSPALPESGSTAVAVGEDRSLAE